MVNLLIKFLPVSLKLKLLFVFVQLILLLNLCGEFVFSRSGIFCLYKSISRLRFMLILSFIDLTSSLVASIKLLLLDNSLFSILNLLGFFSTIRIKLKKIVKENYIQEFVFYKL